MNIGQSAAVKSFETDEPFLSRAEALAAEGCWKDAAALLEAHQEASASSAEVIGKLAHYRSRAGDYDGAILLYRQLIEQRPGEARWLYCLGFQHQQKKQWLEAITAYEECLRLAPRWLIAALRLGDAYQECGQGKKALSVYRQAIQQYHQLTEDQRRGVNGIYARLCMHAARALLEDPKRNASVCGEAVTLLRQAVATDPGNANAWYSLGSVQLKVRAVKEALACFQRAETLGLREPYIYHKMAQVYLKQENPDDALRIYERIPRHKRSAYVLRGMGQCYMVKNDAMNAAKRFHQAIQREPKKFWHYWDFASALIALGAKDQAIEALAQTNQLYKEEHGKDHRTAVAKLEDVRATLPAGPRISFEAVAEIRFGIVSKYVNEKGFGFISDDADRADTFFHITRVKDHLTPQSGARVKYLRETGEKGFQATKVWVLQER